MDTYLYYSIFAYMVIHCSWAKAKSRIVYD
jgi:hypothetical protein